MPAPTTTNETIVLHGPKDLRTEHRNVLPPGSGEVQVAVQSTGLCGSDLHYYVHGRNGDFALRSPLVLGHESSGIVTALGPGVPPHLELKLGDRVAIECGKACGRVRKTNPPSRPSRPSSTYSAATGSSASSQTGAEDADTLKTPVADNESGKERGLATTSTRNAATSDTSDDEDGVTAVGSEGSSIHEHEEDEEHDNCEYCVSGRYNLCQGMRFCSSAKTFPHLDGTLQEYMNHPAHLLHKLPNSCTFEQAALAEPLSVVLHAARRVRLAASAEAGLTPKILSPSPITSITQPSVALSRQRPKRVLVIGAGAVGFLAAALCRTLSDLGESSATIRTIAAMDIDSGKLDALRNAGYADATYTVSTAGPRPTTKEEGLQRSREIADEALLKLAEESGDDSVRLGYDYVFECTGVETCMQTAIYMARTGGAIALVGMGTPNPTLPMSSAALREVDLIGVFRYANTYPEALRLLASPTMRGIEKVMVTQRFKLADTKKAFEVIAAGFKPGELVLKVMVGPNY